MTHYFSHRPTPAEPLAAVYRIDPRSAPVAPAGAHAVEVTDDTGRVIAFAWIVRELDPVQLAAGGYTWIDRWRSLIGRASLRLLP